MGIGRAGSPEGPVTHKAECRLWVSVNGIVLPLLTAADFAGLLPRSGNGNLTFPINEIVILVGELRELGRVSGVFDWLVA